MTHEDLETTIPAGCMIDMHPLFRNFRGRDAHLISLYDIINESNSI